MRWSTLVLSLLPIVSAAPKEKTPKTFSQRVVFTPPSNYTIPRVLYARTAQFKDGTLLATWENYSPEPPPVYFPIFQSTDGGYNWNEIARVQDTANGLGLRYQPFLYILEEPFAGFPKETVLLAGNSIPTDLSSTHIDLYASTDRGRTWQFLSHVAAGGEAVPDNGLTPVWEPFLMRYKDTIICYYSDQRDNATHGQKMSHQTTRDLKNWGPVITDVAYPTYTDRPGMPTVARLPNGKYIMTYEYGGGPAIPTSYSFPVYYKVVADPETFGAATGVSLKTTDGYVPTSSPYVVWSPVGGKNGTIIVSAGSSGDVYINTGLAEPGTPWTRVATPEPSAYTRNLRVLNDPTKLLIMGAGQLPPSTTNKVELSVMDINKL
ncbi:364c42cb-4dd6-4b80-9b76-56aec9a84c5a [Thermothielavioides terrestris]|uniref:364c42cb-4dd6-4b80-9b76-56aec9a84c5a n=1 Tax=Thermothielavioides terrestris TaxID=2587410 RepID=A0A3S4B9N5_9PEZI|nr:364c42cb-4dd6-4b80-9b76-56aec9a84c5a [Thermothielavioides terrestris]